MSTYVCHGTHVLQGDIIRVARSHSFQNATELTMALRRSLPIGGRRKRKSTASVSFDSEILDFYLTIR